METVIVILIVLVAAFLVGRIFYRGFKQKDNCACGCTCCSAADTCADPAAGNAGDTSQEKLDR